jgi:colicin import membrane protein
MEMKVPLAVSAGLHVAVLLWATLSFSSERFNTPPTESLPVDFISDKQFSEITKGIKDAPNVVDNAKPVVEKKADVAKAVEDLKPKVTEKQEVKPTAEKVPPPPPPPEKKPPKPVKEKTAEKPPEPKPDPIAKKIEQIAEKPKEEPKKEQKEAKNTPAPLPPKRPPIRKQPPKPKPPKFDADKIAALLDKREPVRTAATGAIVNPSGSLGRINGQSAQLSQSVLDALRRRISSCWTPPVGAEKAQDLIVVFRVIFNPDGSLRGEPSVVEGAASAYGPVFAESAKRAILQCQPYTMLPRDSYNLWKDIEIGFKPSDMFQ